MSFCHSVPPQDAKWHKVPISGEETKWHKVCHLVAICRVEPLSMPHTENKTGPDTYVY